MDFLPGVPGRKSTHIGVYPLKNLDNQALQEWIELAENRANTYTLLSRVWGTEVDQDLLDHLHAASFPHLPDIPTLDRAYRVLEKSVQEDSPAQLTALATDFARLCLGSDPREGADPYESVHLNKEGLMMQDEWEAVLRLYAELGLARADKTYESEDHLALELECMALLCDRQREALQAGEMPEASWWLDQQGRMLDEHLLKWVPSFIQRVEALGQTDFYKAFGALTGEYLKIDRETLAEAV